MPLFYSHRMTGAGISALIPAGSGGIVKGVGLEAHDLLNVDAFEIFILLEGGVHHHSFMAAVAAFPMVASMLRNLSQL